MTGGSPFTPDQRRELEEAGTRAAAFRGAAKVAAFNGWTFAIFAAVSILFGLFSLPGFLVGVGLAVVARNEFVGRRGIVSYDPAGFDLLWRNQLGLMALIILYCIWSIYRSIAFPDPELDELTAMLGEGTGELVQSLTLGVYAAVIVLTVIFQGLNARYYHIRVARLRKYLSETPQWVLDVQRSVAE